MVKYVKLTLVVCLTWKYGGSKRTRRPNFQGPRYSMNSFRCLWSHKQFVSHLVCYREMESRHLRGMCEIAAAPGHLVLYSSLMKQPTLRYIVDILILLVTPTDTKHICNLNCKWIQLLFLCPNNHNNICILLLLKPEYSVTQHQKPQRTEREAILYVKQANSLWH